MLETLRNKKRSIIGVLVVCFCVLLMFSFGLDTYYSGPKQETAAIKINGDEISFVRFSRSYELLVRQYRDRLGAGFDSFRAMLNLEQQVVDALITERLVGDVAEKFGFAVSARQIEEEISRLPYFNGVVTASAWREFLRGVQMTGVQFESELKKDMVRGQFLNIFSDISIPSEQELKVIYSRDNAEYRFKLLEFKPSRFEDDVKVDEGKLAAFFEKNREKYRAPRAVRISYVEFKPEEFTSKVEVTDEDLQVVYEERQTEFQDPRQYKVRLVELKFDSKDPLAEVIPGVKKEEAVESSPSPKERRKAEADKIVERLKGGETLLKIAEELKLAAPEPKFQLLSSFVEPVQEVLPNLSVGEFSNVIELADGYVVAQLEDTVEARVKPLDEVRQQLVTAVKAEIAPVYMRAAAEEFLAKFQGETTTSLQEYAAKNGRTATVLPEFVKEGGVAPLPRDVRERVVKLLSGDRTSISTADNEFVVEVLDVKESYLPELTEVRDRAVIDFKREESRTVAKDAAESTLKAIKEAAADSGDVFEKLKGKAELSETKLVSRSSGGEGILDNIETRESAFSLTPDKPLAESVIDDGASFYIVKLLERKDADAAMFESKRKELREESTEAGARRIYGAFTETLRKQADIWVNPEVFERGQS